MNYCDEDYVITHTCSVDECTQGKRIDCTKTEKSCNDGSCGEEHDAVGGIVFVLFRKTNI